MALGPPVLYGYYTTYVMITIQDSKYQRLTDLCCSGRSNIPAASTQGYWSTGPCDRQQYFLCESLRMRISIWPFTPLESYRTQMSRIWMMSSLTWFRVERDHAITSISELRLVNRSYIASPVGSYILFKAHHTMSSLTQFQASLASSELLATTVVGAVTFPTVLAGWVETAMMIGWMAQRMDKIDTSQSVTDFNTPALLFLWVAGES